MYRLLSLVVLFFLSSTSVGQGLSVKVRIFDHGPQQADSALNRELATALQGALELRGMKSEKEGIQLYSSAKSFEAASEEFLAVTMIEGIGLQDEAIEKGVEYQIWYAGKPVPDNPEESKFAREYMTRFALEQLINIYDIKILVFPKSQMEPEINQYMDDLIYRHSCEANDVCDDE